MVTKAAVIGIDMGAMDSVAAYVGKGVVDIVQNEMSSRKTTTMISFTDQQRLLGDQALAQFKSNFRNTCRNFRHLLGRGMDAPDIEKERFWSTCELAESSDLGFVGYNVKYRNQPRNFSATQVAAMFLYKMKEVTESWCEAKVNDVVIAVPSYYTDVHRRAVLDAAEICGLHVLRLMNEHTATALGYGIYRSNDFEEKNPTTVVFVSVGHTTFSCCVVQFVKGKLVVLSEASDHTLGGRDMDELLIRYFAAEFEKKHKVDILKNKKSVLKMEDAVQRTKKILSSNSEATVGVECVYEDYDLNGKITRDVFEELCAPLMTKAHAVIDSAIKKCNIPLDEIHYVEIVGGASRVPWIQKLLSEKLGKELSKTVNADESVARGAALQAAMLSPLFKVRDFTVQDQSAHSINIGWVGTAEAEEEDGNVPETLGAEGVSKTAPIFPAGSQFGLLKVLTFYRKGPFDIFAQYADANELLPGTDTNLGTYRVDLAPQTENKKIKVRAKLTLHGIFEIESAHMVEEEEYEDVTKQKKEIVSDEPMPQAEDKPAENAEPTNGDAKPEEKKEEEKKYEWVEVKVTKKRTKKIDIPVVASKILRLSPKELQDRKDQETALQAETREIREREAKRNDVESYIYNMRDKVNGELREFSTQEQKDVFTKALNDAEEWLYDQYDAEAVVFVEKLAELEVFGNRIKMRKQEKEARAEWVPHLEQTLGTYRMCANSVGEEYAHIAAEKKQAIIKECEVTEAWLQDLILQQNKTPDYEDAVLKAYEVQLKNDALVAMADPILSEPKPKPPKEEEKPEAEKTTVEGEQKKENDMDVDKPEP